MEMADGCFLLIPLLPCLLSSPLQRRGSLMDASSSPPLPSPPSGRTWAYDKVALDYSSEDALTNFEPKGATSACSLGAVSLSSALPRRPLRGHASWPWLPVRLVRDRGFSQLSSLPSLATAWFGLGYKH